MGCVGNRVDMRNIYGIYSWQEVPTIGCEETSRGRAGSAEILYDEFTGWVGGGGGQRQSHVYCCQRGRRVRGWSLFILLWHEGVHISLILARLQ